MVHCSERGYQNNDIVNVVVEKTLRYRNDLLESTVPVHIDVTSAYSLCSVLAAMESLWEINVLDFGGAAGAHYFLARSILPLSCRLNWVVVETAAMVELAKPALSNEELDFTSELNEAADILGRIDLLHTSGALQCVDKPYEYLRKLVAMSAQRIAFGRLGLTKGDHDVITTHESWLSWNGPGPMPVGKRDRKVIYPFVFPRESEVIGIVSECYREIARFSDSTGIFPVDDEPVLGFGMLVERLVRK
jgi:putative methyltransferase (TIGR04325 family)